MNEKVKSAAALFDEGFYCSQSVLGAFCEQYGLDNETTYKISCGLNSGARCSEICGAVTGAILVIGLKYGSTRQICNQKTEEFVKIFKAKNGEVVCRNILGCDISTPDGKEKAIGENLFNTTCRDMVISAVEILTDLCY